MLNSEQVNDPTRAVSTWDSKERTQLPLGHFLILSESPCMDCARPRGQQLESMVRRFKTTNQLSWAQEPLYHWMEHFFSWVEHMLFCHIICKSRVMLQDFYLQPFFFMLGFRQGKWKSISLGWVTEHNFKGIPSFPTFCCFWHKSWELDYLESSRTPQSTFPILSFQNILVFIIRYSQKGEGFINFFCEMLQIWGDQEQNPCQTKL